MGKNPQLFKCLLEKKALPIHEIAIKVMTFHFTFSLRQAERKNKFQSNFSFFPITQKKKSESQNRWTKCYITKPSRWGLYSICAINSHLKTAPDHFTKPNVYYSSSFKIPGFSEKPAYRGVAHRHICLPGLLFPGWNPNLRAVIQRFPYNVWGGKGVQAKLI